MSNMSRNNSTTSLMGFSVHQPQLGAMLEFFPAMGSQQLDEMIDAYIPGDLSILDKRTAVTMEFFQHSMTTGELFKFFMVYPTNAAESPANSLQDSTYGSAFTSPVVSEPRWSASTSKKARIANTRTTGATAADFSHIPGMKIMTRDGQDVTNSASRGCKTKEQRDHAHLMRIMKACDACKKKKVRCDPSHKRTAVPAGADSKVKKAAKKASSASKTIQASVPPIDTMQHFTDAFNHSFDSFMTSFDTPAQDSWEQFVSFDQDEVMAAPNVDFNYDFFYDPAGHFSPSSSLTSGFNSGSSSNSASPSQTFTPIQTSAGSSMMGPADGTSSKDADGSHGTQASAGVAIPSLPYMESGGVDVGNYVDFALYSPESTSSLDDDLSSYSQEVRAASVSEQVSTLPAYTVQQRVSSSRGGSPRMSSVVAGGDGLDSRSAFAHMEQYGFDLGTLQGDHMSAGVISSARIRGPDVHLHGVNANSSAGVLASTIDIDMLRASESLVPRGPEDVPRPPVPQDLAAAALDTVAGDRATAGSARSIVFSRSSTRSGLDDSRSGSVITSSKNVQQTQAGLTTQHQSRKNAAALLESENRLGVASWTSTIVSMPPNVVVVDGDRPLWDIDQQSTAPAMLSRGQVVKANTTPGQVSISCSSGTKLDTIIPTATASVSGVSQQTTIARNTVAQANLAAVSTARSTSDDCCQPSSIPTRASRVGSFASASGSIVASKQPRAFAEIGNERSLTRRDQQALSGSQLATSQQSMTDAAKGSIQQLTSKDRLDTITTFGLLAAAAVILLLMHRVLAKHAALASRDTLEMTSLLALSMTVALNKPNSSAVCTKSTTSTSNASTPTRTPARVVATTLQKVQRGLRRVVCTIGGLPSGGAGFPQLALPRCGLVSLR